MTKPRIAGLLAEIEALKGRLLDANQCAARALESRDKALQNNDPLLVWVREAQKKQQADEAEAIAYFNAVQQQDLYKTQPAPSVLTKPRPGFFARLMGR